MLGEGRLLGVNNFLVQPMPADTEWQDFTFQEMENARSAYSAIFATRIQHRTDRELELPLFADFFKPTVAEIERDNPGHLDRNMAQHLALRQKLKYLLPAILTANSVSIQREEQDLQTLEEDDQTKINYHHLVELMRLTYFRAAGFSFEGHLERSPFFVQHAAGFETLTTNIGSFVSKIFPDMYWAKLGGMYPSASTSIRFGRSSYNAVDVIAGADNDALGRTQEKGINNFVLDLEHEKVSPDPAFIEELRKQSEGIAIKGCPVRRSGLLLAPHVGHRYNPNPLMASYDKIFTYIEGPST